MTLHIEVRSEGRTICSLGVNADGPLPSLCVDDDGCLQVASGFRIAPPYEIVLMRLEPGLQINRSSPWR